MAAPLSVARLGRAFDALAMVLPARRALAIVRGLADAGALAVPALAAVLDDAAASPRMVVDCIMIAHRVRAAALRGLRIV